MTPITGGRRSQRRERESRRRQELKEAIIKAAERVIVKRGYAAMTMDDVAMEAELSKATVYNYFGSKGDLVLELFLEYFDQFYKKICEIKSQLCPLIDKLRQIIAYFLLSHQERESLSRILMVDKAFLQKMRFFVGGEMARSPGRKRDLMSEIKYRRKMVLDEVAAIYAEGIEKGELRPLDPAIATQLTEAILQGFIHSRFWGRPRLAVEKETELLLDFILHGLGGKQDSAKGVSL